MKNSDILNRLNLEKNKYFVVSAHREENINNDSNFTDLISSLNKIAEKYDYPIIVSTHPRTRRMIDAKVIKLHHQIQLLKPLGFNDYNALQMNSMAVLSDSGTISEESSILNFPALNIRQAHERPEGMDEGTLIMSGLKKDRVIEAIEIVTKQHHKNRIMKVVSDYDVDNVSKKVLRIILSYTDYVNRTVWHKSN